MTSIIAFLCSFNIVSHVVLLSKSNNIVSLFSLSKYNILFYPALLSTFLSSVAIIIYL